MCVVIVGGLSTYLATADISPLVRETLNRDVLVRRAIQHIELSMVVTILVMLIAVPLGVIVTRPRFRWLSPPVLAFANAGQAIPNIGLIALIGIAWFVGFWAVVVALTAYAVLPVLRNTITGIEQVDRGVLDAARGMGMSSRHILMRVELVLAVPVIAAGARTALVLAVATVPIGDFLGAGGLGNQIFIGIKLNRPEALFSGAVLIAVVALMLDWLGSLLERLLTPRGLR
jgi:osmoprotectant transport system permease protein